MKYENWVFGKNGALFRASAKGQLDIARELVADGADVNAVSPNGFTPLHRAAENGHLQLVEFLLDQGADADAASSENTTPMRLAKENGHTTIINTLEYCRHQSTGL